MDIRTILVNLDIDYPSPTLLTGAVELARRFDAQLIGLAAAEPSAALLSLQDGAAPVGLYTEARDAIEARLRALEADFEAAVPGDRRGRFISEIAAPTGSLIAWARLADLILVGAHIDSRTNGLRNVDVGELVLATGRPVLLAAAGADADEIRLGTVLVGWKDTREARRAVVDALPFLKRATRVIVAAVSEGDRVAEKAGVDDVVAWLDRHGIKAEGEVYPTADVEAENLAELAMALHADLVVTGAYGHNRVREWLVGGATRNLLFAPTLNRLMSN